MACGNFLGFSDASLVGRKNLSQGSKATDQGEPSDLRMNQEPTNQTYRVQDHTEEQDHEFKNLLTACIEHVTNQRDGPDNIENDFFKEIIATSYNVLPFPTFHDTLKRIHKYAVNLNIPKTVYWNTIITALFTPEVERAYLDLYPEFKREEPIPTETPTSTPRKTQPTTTPTPNLTSKQTPEQNPDLKNLSTYGQVQYYALVRKTTVFDYILEQSRSPSFAKIHTFIQHHGNYRLSQPGKVIYDRSFAWITRELGISMRTVSKAFTWMAQRKLVTKIATQDHRIRKNSRWYVCTSMAQNLKLWSMAYQEKERPQPR